MKDNSFKNFHYLKANIGLCILKNTSLNELVDDLIGHEHVTSYYEHWYLAYLATDNIDKKRKYLKISQSLLNKCGQKNSNKNHINSCLNKIILHKNILKCDT